MAPGAEPEYSYASEGASWNPALRPNSSSQVPEQPNGKIAPSDSSATGDRNESDLPVSQPGNAPFQVKLDFPEPESNGDSDFFDHFGSGAQMQVGPVVDTESPLHAQESLTVGHWGAESETSSFYSHQGKAPSAAAVHEYDTSDTEVSPKKSHDVNLDQENTANNEQDENAGNANGNYDYQSESTALDKAIQDRADAPLVSDDTPKATPLDEWGPVAGDFDLGPLASSAEPRMTDSSAADVPAAEVSAVDDSAIENSVNHLSALNGAPHASAATGTNDPATNTTEHSDHRDSTTTNSQKMAEEPNQTQPDIDWGDLDTDFEIPAPASAEPAAGSSTDANGRAQDNLAAQWAAVLDDDLLLDNDFLSDPENAEGEHPAPFPFDDHDGFLEDKPADAQAPEVKPVNRYAPVVPQQQQSAAPAVSNPYIPAGPPNQNAPGARPGPTPYRSTYSAQSPSPYQSSYQAPAARPPLPAAESFVAKSKGGYHSPYDLPDDIAVPRKRHVAHHVPPVVGPPVAPPRSSSMSVPSGSMVRGPPPPPPTRGYTPPSSSHSVQAPPSAFSTQPPAEQPKPSGLRRDSNDFFAELPMVTKPKHATSSRFVPQTLPTPPPALAPPAAVRTVSATGPPPVASAPQLITQLRAPEPLNPYSEDRLSPNRSATMPLPSPTNRYSPAPTGVPPAKNRYSPVPPSGPAGSSAPGAPHQYPTAPPAPARAATYNQYPSAPPAQVAAPPSQYAPAPMGHDAKPLPSVPGPYAHAPPPASPAEPPMASQNRFAPPPPPRGPSPAGHTRYASEPQKAPWLPRTSSPLAYSATPPQPHHHGSSSLGAVETLPQQDHTQNRPPMDKATTFPVLPVHGGHPVLEPVAENETYDAMAPPRPQAPQHDMPRSTATPPPGRGSTSSQSSQLSSPRRRGHYAPSAQATAPTADPTFAPPRRSQTSSPGKVYKPLGFTATDRPASAHGPVQPLHSMAAPNLMQAVAPQPAYHEMPLVPPQDERMHDPLERWKGAPIFAWGIGGVVVTSFPKYIPRYSAGQLDPFMKPSQEEIKTTTITDIMPLSDMVTKFPGPLKKGKKKEVLAWLKSNIEEQEKNIKDMAFGAGLTVPANTLLDEKLLLWKAMALLTEHDGVLEGNPTVEQAVRDLIAVQTSEVIASPVATTQPPALPEAFDPNAFGVLRNHLTKGDREQAVWHAVDQRLWAHALLIASTLQNTDIWKQVVQEFVRKEIRKAGDNTEPLAALYQVFAGNWEESIDELVSVSARAGFQMVAVDGSGAQKDALAGLDKWRETLSLILNNRSPGDAQALVSLGKLLAGYGRMDAAYLCFIFARSAVSVSGADDPNAHFTLIGSDRASQGLDFGKDLESILLTEVYEYAMTLGTPPAPPMPHLQAYKLYHAEVLAENGRRTEAMQYCDAIGTAITSKSNRSPYYTQSLMQWLDETMKRVSQAPNEASSSWKPSMEKVSSSLWGKFNNFVAGEEPTPSVRKPSDTPPVSQSPVNADLYGAYLSGAPPSSSAPPPTNSRYAPQVPFAPRGSLEGSRPSYFPQAQSAYPAQSYQSRASLESAHSTYEPRQSTDSGPSSNSPRRTASYNPLPGAAPYAPSQQRAVSGPGLFPPGDGEGVTAGASYVATPYMSAQITPQASSYQTPQPGFGGYALPEQGAQYGGYQPQASEARDEAGQANGEDFKRPSLGDMQSSSYEPPSYTPYEPDDKPWDADEDDSPKESKPKKKMMEDDDDDAEFIRRAAQLKKDPPKAPASSSGSHEVDDIVKRAAEADANKPPQEKKGWFGWLKGSNTSGPIKAKLGEESSFVYDPELKKWVNKKAGATTETASKPPPPPPSRPMSAVHTPTLSQAGDGGGGGGGFALSSAPSMGPPPARATPPPPSSAVEGGMPAPPAAVAALAGAGAGLRSASLPLLQRPPNSALGPPSRPGTATSQASASASDLDDLIGTGTGTVRRGQKKKRGGRSVDAVIIKSCRAVPLKSSCRIWFSYVRDLFAPWIGS
ncbi:hypothetical protein EJ06DRAFT_551128 [Trichodelitschia bisporula]|uniref:Protein transport protein sec16 n=1 Tax=Trichodelitschia bisporula TaxID=703511 RepID=A0A6G1HLX3_9PEZI|nr:hypothetical protein EJ06DRAFT_551128 [Trichodelitschia bisporula]